MDVLKFINCVRKRDCIYNKSCADYRQRDVVFDSWRSIARDMNVGVIECKEKWHNLRSNYMRERKKVLGPGVKKWHLLDALRFLEPHHCARSGPRRKSRRKSVTDIHSIAIPDLDELESSTPQNVTSTAHFTFDDLELQSDQGDSHAHPDHDVGFTRTTSKVETCTSHLNGLHEKRDKPDVDSDLSVAPCDIEILSSKAAEETGDEVKRRQRSFRRQRRDRIDYEFLKQFRKLSRHLNESTEDPDRMFLLSLLPLVKQLSPRDNVSFRVQVQRILEHKLNN